MAGITSCETIFGPEQQDLCSSPQFPITKIPQAVVEWKGVMGLSQCPLDHWKSERLSQFKIVLDEKMDFLFPPNHIAINTCPARSFSEDQVLKHLSGGAQLPFLWLSGIIRRWESPEFISWVSHIHKVCRGNEGGFYCIIPWNVTDTSKGTLWKLCSDHPEPHCDSKPGEVGIDSGEAESAWLASDSAAHSPSPPQGLFFPLKSQSWALSLSCGQRSAVSACCRIQGYNSWYSQGIRHDTKS